MSIAADNRVATDPRGAELTRDFFRAAAHSRFVGREDIEGFFEISFHAARAKFETMRSAVEAMVSGLHAAIEAGHAAPLNEVIADLERQEKAVKAEGTMLAREATKTIKVAQRRAPDLLPVLRHAAVAVASIQDQFVVLYRDARWRLMCDRADTHRDERGPVFSDPRKLRAYLKSSRV